MVSPIAKWRCFGLPALAKPYLFHLVKDHFYAFEWRAFDTLVVAVAERVFFGKAATAPGIGLARLDKHRYRIAFGYSG